jgi:hypothetical protein
MAKLSLPVLIALIATATVVVLLVVAQFVVPPWAESRIEDRLTEGGGEASASVDAVPAAKLLIGDGDSLDVTGSGLDLEIDPEEEVFKRLDGFDSVDIELDDFRAGPFDVDTFALARDGSGIYTMQSQLTTTGSALLQYGAERLGVPGSSLLPLITGDSEDANVTIPVDLDMELESDDGRIIVTGGTGEVAGYPAGPLAELITAAIVVQI